MVQKSYFIDIISGEYFIRSTILNYPIILVSARTFLISIIIITVHKTVQPDKKVVNAEFGT